MSAATSLPTIESPADTLARLREQRQKRDKSRADARILREIEKENLRERYESELGAEGSEFMIVDTGHLDDPLVVVKRPALVQWTKWEQSKQTPTDRYDMVAPSLVLPTRDEYNALREKRYGAEMQSSNALAVMLGLLTEADLGK